MIPLNLKQWEVLAILAGRLTQIRRVVKPQPTKTDTDYSWSAEPGEVVMYDGWPTKLVESRGRDKRDAGILTPKALRSPFGSPGATMYGRETWAVAMKDKSDVFYRADAPGYRAISNSNTWRSPVTMPQRLSRIHFTANAVRVQRVQEITPDDVFACGIDLHMPEVCIEFGVEAEAKACYSQRWDSDNGEGSWNANPWVWVADIERKAT